MSEFQQVKLWTATNTTGLILLGMLLLADLALRTYPLGIFQLLFILFLSSLTCSIVSLFQKDTKKIVGLITILFLIASLFFTYYQIVTGPSIFDFPIL